jgi:hypothetical protein
MAIFGCKFANVLVSSNGEEIQPTVPYCGKGCRHFRIFGDNGYCYYRLEDHLKMNNYCDLYSPNTDHIWYNHQWWN